MGELFEDALELSKKLDVLLDKIEIIDLASISDGTLDLTEWVHTTNAAIKGLATHMSRLTILTARLAAKEDGVEFPDFG